MSRVELRDAIGRFVKFVSGREAAHLIGFGRASISVRTRKRKVLSIALSAPPAPIGERTPFSLAMYQGQKYTYRDAVTHFIELRELKEADADLFRLSVTDNLVAVR